MLKIMLIDDEYYFRQALKISLPWEELGFEICGEAENGADAFEQIDILQPDIALVDINMPRMDGLEFSEAVRKKGYNIKIIIFTGHNEFNYAKQAVKLGVQNYILKPINENELKETLINLKHIIEKESKFKSKIEFLKNEVKENLPILQDRFFNDLIKGKLIMQMDEFRGQLKYLNIDIISEKYRVLAIEIDFDESKDWDKECKQLWDSTISNIAREILGESYLYGICSDDIGRILAIIGYAKESDAWTDMITVCERIRYAVYNSNKLKITIGIGNEYTDIKDVSNSYREALVALKSRLLTGDIRVIPYDTAGESGLMGNFYQVEHRIQILISMRLGNIEEVYKLICKIFDELKLKNVSTDIVFMTCIELVSTCFEFLADVGQNYKVVFKNSFNPFENILQQKTMFEMESWIKNIYMKVVGFLNENRSTKPAKLVKEAKEYIHENYWKAELKIEDIAGHLHVNDSYLIHLFKKETGMTIVEYLTELRIKKAKELFDSSKCFISDVADKVGYSDANYFSKCFKKYYNLSPNKYIRNKG